MVIKSNLFNATMLLTIPDISISFCENSSKDVPVKKFTKPIVKSTFKSPEIQLLKAFYYAQESIKQKAKLNIY